MVKFASRQDVGYRKVSGHLQVMAENAPDVTRSNWDEQDRFEKGTLLILSLYQVLIFSPQY
jgi:hypothetical protein